MEVEPPQQADSVRDLSGFTLGNCEPRRVFTPYNVEALSKELQTARQRGEAVVFFGGGTLQSMGNAPSRYDAAFELVKLSELIAYEPRDLTIAIGAGMTLATLDRTLQKEGQFIPLDAPRPTQGTVGGALAAGWLGPRRGSYGRPRDFVIGTTIALTDGTLAHSGGMVTKNVTGYDMSKLYIGSLGTLGALVRVNFKTLPRPPAQRIALAPLPERTRDRVIHHLSTLEIEPTAALIVTGFEQEIMEASDSCAERLILLFEGSQPLIERATRDARSQLGAAGVPGTHLIDRGTSEILQRIVNAYVTPLERRSVTYRSLGERTTLSERYDFLAREARRAGLRLETIADLCNGDIIARVSAPTSDALERTIVPFDETLTTRLERRALLAAPSFVRHRLDAWGNTTAPVAAMHALKERFDPTAMLAPGRLVGGI